MASSAVQNFVAVGVGALGVFYLREYFKGGVCRSKARLDGKTVLITGCNVGIGKETALDLSRRGARVLMACRNIEAANETAEKIRSSTKGEVQVYKLDLASLASVRDCATEIKNNEERLDVLINNAGVMMCPFQKTKDGFEMQIGTNHLGHFLFTNLLLDKIKASAPSRIVNVSSRAHERGKINLEDINFERRAYKPMVAYEQSKLANVLFTLELIQRLRGTDVTCYSLHPGVVRTELGRHIESVIGPTKHFFWSLLYFFTKSPKEGAQTSIYCAVDEEAGQETGHYYSDCKKKEPQPLAKDKKLAKELWELSATLVGLSDQTNVKFSQSGET